MASIACAQLDVAYGDPATNTARCQDVLRRHREADLLVFPEAFLTGYCATTVEEANRIALARDNEWIDSIQETVDEVDTLAVVGAVTADRTRLFNSAYLLQPGLPAQIYDKTHLPELGVDKHVCVGRSLPVFDTKLGRIGVLVCFDLRVPEAARTLALKGAELIVLPTNWPVGAHAGPNFMAAARAGENRVFVATCNRVGSENGFEFIGQSGIYDVTGKTLAKASETSEEVIEADVDLSIARSKRNVVRPGEFETEVFATRQPDLYSVITDRGL